MIGLTRSSLSLISLVVCTLGCSPPEPIDFDFRDIEIGMPVSEIPADSLEDERRTKDFVTGSLRLAGFTDYVVFQAGIIDSRVESILLTYSESDYFQLKRAMIEKFGKPHRTSMVGGKETVAWLAKDGEFVMDSMFASISSSKADEATRKSDLQNSL